MSIRLKARIEFTFVPDGANNMEVPTAQTLIMNNDFGANGGFVIAPGGNAPSQANLQTAIGTISTNFQAGVTAAIAAQIAAWASGGG